jgi:hypothetical protein
MTKACDHLFGQTECGVCGAKWYAPEPTPDGFLRHAVSNSTQYSAGWQQVCQELLDARAEISRLRAGLKVLKARYDIEDCDKSDCVSCRAIFK